MRSPTCRCCTQDRLEYDVSLSPSVHVEFLPNPLWPGALQDSEMLSRIETSFSPTVPSPMIGKE